MREGVGIDYQRQLLSCDIGHRFKRDYESRSTSIFSSQPSVGFGGVRPLSDLKSADEAANWVHKTLSAKDTLSPAPMQEPSKPNSGSVSPRSKEERQALLPRR